MKKITSTFSINQKPKSDDLIVSINAKKEILFNKKTKTFFHALPKKYERAYKIFEQNIMYKIFCTKYFLQSILYKTCFAKYVVQTVWYKIFCIKYFVQNVVYKIFCTKSSVQKFLVQE